MARLTDVVTPPKPPARRAPAGDQADLNDEEEQTSTLDELRSKLETARDSISDALDMLEEE